MDGVSSARILTCQIDRGEDTANQRPNTHTHIIVQYNLLPHVKGGYVYLEICKTIYGLPQAGILANKQLQEKPEPAGYYEVAHTPEMWRHVSHPVQFSLVGDNFGVKYIGKENAEYLIKDMKKAGYKVAIDWDGSLYCGITLEWNYKEQWLDKSMPGYIEKLLKRHEHKMSSRP